MKFSSTVDSLSRENRYLKQILGFLALGMILLSVAVLLLYDKPAKLILRSARGLEILTVTPLQRSQADVEQAVRLMLRARLDTETVAPEVFLSQRQMELRATEQRELKSREFTQAILIRSLTLRDGSAVVSLDRVIRVGDVRSAISAQVSISFQEIEPNEMNPYGLRLASLVPQEAPASGTARATGGPNPQKTINPGEGK